MTEQYADIDGIKFCYEILGKEDGYPVFHQDLEILRILQ